MEQRYHPRLIQTFGSETWQVLCIRADVTKEDDVQRAVDEAVKEFGRIDYAALVFTILASLVLKQPTLASLAF